MSEHEPDPGDHTTPPREAGRPVKRNLRCPCGELIEAKDEDELVERASEHLKEAHPHLATQYSREEILFMAY